MKTFTIMNYDRTIERISNVLTSKTIDSSPKVVFYLAVSIDGRAHYYPSTPCRKHGFWINSLVGPGGKNTLRCYKTSRTYEQEPIAIRIEEEYLSVLRHLYETIDGITLEKVKQTKEFQKFIDILEQKEKEVL